jgi:hypothetical protein
MNRTLNSSTVQLVGGLLIGVAAIAAFLIGGDTGSALVTGGLVFGFVLLVHFGRRRSESLAVMSGIGDERTRHLYTRATAFTGAVMALVLPGWWLVTVAQGEPDTTLNVLCAIFGFTWIGAAIVLPRRG